jgi:NTP pyrophosphatase (non-canonical NTP hydrolase)
MEFQTYQTEALRYAAYPNKGNDFMFLSLALNEEAGEVAGKIKKLMRDKGVFTPRDLSQEDRQTLLKELGDVLWYVTALAQEIGTSLEAVAEKNLAKITDRHARGTLQGAGDER